MEQAVKQLERAKIVSDKKELLNQALFTFKQSGELEQAMVNWDALSTADKTWANCKDHFIEEFANRKKHAKIEARHAGYGGAANVSEATDTNAEDVAMMTCEIIQQLNEQNEAKFEKMMQKIQEQHALILKMASNTNKPSAQNNTSGNTNSTTNGAGGRTNRSGSGNYSKWNCPPRSEWKLGEPHPVTGKTLRMCKHCKRLAGHKDEHCPELEANAHRRPPRWKSAL